MIRILGIDPGSCATGFGIITAQSHSYQYLASGCIKVAKLPWHLRLRQIYKDLIYLIDKYKPEAVAIEKVFVHKNALSALKLGHARGVAMLAVANSDLITAEYAPRVIKKAVVGNGSADKSQIQLMIKEILKLSECPASDAADALAIALCHAHHLRY